MAKREIKKQPDSYLCLARLLQDASVVMGMRNSLGYTITAEERNRLQRASGISETGELSESG